jgi:hypothetical protein
MTRPIEPDDCRCRCHFDENARPLDPARWTPEDHAAEDARMAEMEAQAERWKDPAYRKESHLRLRARLFGQESDALDRLLPEPLADVLEREEQQRERVAELLERLQEED